MRPVRMRWKTIIIVCFVLSALSTTLFLFKSCRSRSYFRLQAAISFVETMQLDWSFPQHPNQACVLPRLHPFDDAILPYVTIPERLQCDWHQQPITMIDDKHVLRFNQSALQAAGYSSASLWCYYRTVWRRDGDDDTVEYGEEKLMTGYDVMKTDFVSISCRNWLGVTVYSYIHAHPTKINTKKRRQKDVDDNKISCLVFIMDSLSRLNAMRQLPKTYYFFTRTMNGVVLKGFNKVGDNTWPNVLPMLTGRQVNVDHVKYSDYIDDYPLVWKNFSNAGYVTLYAEDMTEFAVFNYYTKGFKEVPTDHYMRPFWTAAQSSSIHDASQPLCYGHTSRHRIHMDYIRDFVVRYVDTPYFAYSHITEIGHEFMNRFGACDADLVSFFQDLYLGGFLNQTVVFFLGDHGARFDPLRSTYAGRVEDNMPLAAVYLPPVLKSKFPEIDARLQSNTGRLTTMFDIHETFMDILRFATDGVNPLHGVNPLNPKNTHSKKRDMQKPSTTDPAISHNGSQRRFHATHIFINANISTTPNSFTNSTASAKRAAVHTTSRPDSKKYSLFTEIPLSRTCDDVGIIPQYCSCGKETTITTNSPIAVMATTAIVDKINTLLLKYTDICDILSLRKVHSATVIDTNMYKDPHSPDTTRVRVIVETVPGGGMFEAVVVMKSGSDEPEVSDEISRVNRFMGQDTCVTKEMLRHSDIRKYCYCGDALYLKWWIGL